MAFIRAVACLGSILIAESATSAQGKVWVVDDQPGVGVDFSLVQTAVDVAQDGDAILIRPGDYAWARIHGKALTLTADPAGVVRMGGLDAGGIGSAQSVVVRGIVFDGGHNFSIGACQGPVLVQDCAVDPGSSPEAAVYITNSGAVTFANCSVLGSTTSILDSKTPPAVYIQGSSVAMYDCVAIGAKGADGGSTISYLTANDGGMGVTVKSGFLFASGSKFEGGAGGRGGYYYSPFGIHYCGAAGDGASGMYVEAGDVQLLDCVVAGGAGGPPGTGGFYACDPLTAGNPGSPTTVVGGSLSTLPGLAHHIRPLAPATFGQTVSLVLSGSPGDLAFYGLSTGPGFLFAQPLSGVVALGFPISVFFAGVVPASGQVQAMVTVPSPSPAADKLESFFQGGFVTPSFEIVLGSPSVLISLAPGF